MILETFIVSGYELTGGDATFVDSSPVSNVLYQIDAVVSNLSNDQGNLFLEESNDGIIWTQVGSFQVNLVEGINTFYNVCVVKSQFRLRLTTGSATGRLSIRSTIDKPDTAERYTQAQRNLIQSPFTGQTIYNKSTNFYEFFDGIKWNSMSAGSITGALLLSNPISPPDLLIASIDDFNPTDLSITSMMRIFTTRNAGSSLTGIVAPLVGNQVLFVRNVGAKNIKFKNEDTGSIPVNRFELKSDITMGEKESAMIVYDQDSSRWIVIALNV